MKWERPSGKSTTVNEIAYDADIRSLFVKFSDGKIYEYLKVPRSLYIEILTSPAPGKVISKSVKGVYNYTRAG